MILARRYPVLVEPEELLDMLSCNDAILLDVRKEEDYIQGHIPDAVSLPLAKVLESMNPKQLYMLFRKVGVDVDVNNNSRSSKHVVVYDDTFGALASRVAWALEYIGYERVSLLSITYSRWVSLGYEIEKGSSKEVNPEPTIIIEPGDINADDGILATYEYIQSILEGIRQLQYGNISSKVALLDVRERLNYLDHHIPYAMNIPWKAFAGEDRILKSVDEINSLLSHRKITRNDEVIVYCGSVGTLSGLSYYALRLAGYTKVRLYARSLKEWRSLNLPVEGFKDAHYWDLSAE
ncbi:MAG: rhodanese-like domain-containing protein [Candidatus Nitrosocaldus sp.]